MKPGALAVLPQAGSTPSRPGLHAWLLAAAAALFTLHLVVVAFGPYGPHRDALLYYAMGEHLRLFAMDSPPFIAILARAFTAFGNVEVVTHIPVAAAHAALVILAGSFAARAGGGRGAQALAATCVASAPVFMRAGSLFQPVVFDQLWWTAALWALAALGRPGVETHDAHEARAGSAVPGAPAARRWLLLGAVLGLGLLTKLTALVLGGGVFIAILATPLRRALLTPWPWLGAALAIVIGSPAIIGQVVLGWPFFGQFQDLADAQLSRVTPASFVAAQLRMVGPIVLVAAAVTLRLLTSRDTGLRAVAWAALGAFALMLLAGGKAYYIAPIWPALIGIAVGWIDARLRTGAVSDRAAGPPVADALHDGRLRRVAVHAVLWVLVAGYGAVTLPLGLPFLAPEPMSRYAARLGAAPVTSNVGERLSLPQDYADMLGWEDRAAATQEAWQSLPPGDRDRAVILATNYGRAGAIDWFRAAGMPRAIAPVGSYWFWGPGERPGEVMIVVGVEADELATSMFSVAVEFARVRRPWGVPEEQDVPIVIARGPVRTLQEVWPEFRGRN